jgi:hypothetical protein
MWVLVQVPGEIHVAPVDDLRPHDLNPKCWCRPVEDTEEPDMWTHNSLDGREAYETGERLMQ